MQRMDVGHKIARKLSKPPAMFLTLNYTKYAPKRRGSQLQTEVKSKFAMPTRSPLQARKPSLASLGSSFDSDSMRGRQSQLYNSGFKMLDQPSMRQIGLQT